MICMQWYALNFSLRVYYISISSDYKTAIIYIIWNGARGSAKTSRDPAVVEKNTRCNIPGEKRRCGRCTELSFYADLTQFTFLLIHFLTGPLYELFSVNLRGPIGTADTPSDNMTMPWIAAKRKMNLNWPSSMQNTSAVVRSSYHSRGFLHWTTLPSSCRVCKWASGYLSQWLCASPLLLTN